MKKRIEEVIIEKFHGILGLKNDLYGFKLSISAECGCIPESLTIHAVDNVGMVLGQVSLTPDELRVVIPMSKYKFSKAEILRFGEQQRLISPQPHIQSGDNGYEDKPNNDGNKITTPERASLDSDRLLRVMHILSETFPEEYYADIAGAARSVLAALDGDA